MAKELLIIISLLVIISYILEVAARKIHLSSVIFLIGIGLLLEVAVSTFKIKLPEMTSTLILLGGLSLVFIVLQGAMELKVEKQKRKMIVKMFVMSIFPMICLSLAGTAILHISTGISYKTALLNIIPLTVMSSSIAVPGASVLPERPKEEVVYESSFSDIIGLLFFNFVIRDKGDLLHDSTKFIFHLFGMIIVTMVASLFIGWLLGKLKTSIRFIPILATLLLIFEISEYLEWPALILIFVFGIFIGNIHRISELPLIRKIHPENIMSQSREFFTIVSEFGFLLRSLFFLVFGFFIHPKVFIDLKGWGWSLGLLFLGYIIRWGFLKILRINILPNLFFAPRGLVTILLFMYIPAHLRIGQITMSVVVQTVILSIIIMSAGSFFIRKSKIKEDLKEEIREIF